MGKLSRLAATASDNRSFREGAIDLIAERVAFDAAVFHALSPRVSFDTAAVRGVDRASIAASMRHWDQWAVELGRFRDVGIQNGGVATDRDALPARGRARTLFERAFGGSKRARAAAFVHLIVRERIVSALILVRWRDLPFSVDDVRYLRSIAPLLSIADALHQHLDQAERATMPRVLRCHDQRLTPHQRELVEHVALGHTNAAIATSLGRSANTVRNTLAEVMRRLGAANRADVVRLAVLR
jgi:DNA-binding CsgD family transcriptional regulator